MGHISFVCKVTSYRVANQDPLSCEGRHYSRQYHYVHIGSGDCSTSCLVGSSIFFCVVTTVYCYLMPSLTLSCPLLEELLHKFTLRGQELDSCERVTLPFSPLCILGTFLC